MDIIHLMLDPGSLLLLTCPAGPHCSSQCAGVTFTPHEGDLIFTVLLWSLPWDRAVAQASLGVQVLAGKWQTGVSLGQHQM